jgi:hypothetical protein
MIVVGSFLAGAIISLLIPAGVFLAVLAWHVHAVGRVPGGEPRPEPGSPEREQ